MPARNGSRAASGIGGGGGVGGSKVAAKGGGPGSRWRKNLAKAPGQTKLPASWALTEN